MASVCNSMLDSMCCVSLRCMLVCMAHMAAGATWCAYACPVPTTMLGAGVDHVFYEGHIIFADVFFRKALTIILMRGQMMIAGLMIAGLYGICAGVFRLADLRHRPGTNRKCWPPRVWSVNKNAGVFLLVFFVPACGSSLNV